MCRSPAYTGVQPPTGSRTWVLSLFLHVIFRQRTRKSVRARAWPLSASACAAIQYMCVYVRHSSQCGCGKQRVSSVWYSSSAHTAADGWESSAVMPEQKKSQLSPPPHLPIRRHRTVLTHGDRKTRSQQMIARWVGVGVGVGLGARVYSEDTDTKMSR